MSHVACMASLGVLVLAACSGGDGLLDPRPMDPPVLSSTELCFRQDSLVGAAGQIRTPDKDFEIIARLLPGGFGGHFAGGMYLVYPDPAPDTRTVAGILQGCSGRKVTNFTPVLSLGVLHGNYDWIQLSTWRARIESDPSVTVVLSDIDESINRLAIGVPTEAARVQLIARLGPLKIPAAGVDVFIMHFPPPTD